ncbi:MAG: glycosyltransferase, partial [Verrucomicrobiota bacterium]
RKDLVALTPTRIVRRKNLEAGIEIVAWLKKKGMSLRWLITGAPDPHNADAMKYFTRLTALRKDLDVEDEVVFLCERIKDRISNEDLRGLFSVSDMLIFPSKGEGFGIPALEGGLARMFLVLSDIPALREIAGDNAVYIKEGAEPAQVADDIINGLESCPYIGFRRKLIDKYSWRAVFEDRIRSAIEQPEVFWPEG